MRAKEDKIFQVLQADLKFLGRHIADVSRAALALDELGLLKRVKRGHGQAWQSYTYAPTLLCRSYAEQWMEFTRVLHPAPKRKKPATRGCAIGKPQPQATVVC